ncbi:interferon-related developmental regulator-domain-containing protein [Xylariaceae sp. FL0594]|nr:interferon-related developmental regulator-domain-containing protein [Xylariaceae sp. FL0594]
MRDLRKKILLESGKTVSRKARARPDSHSASPIASPAPSRGGSALNSRHVSEEEDNISDSDYNESVANSVANSEDGDEHIASWPDKLRDRIAELLDRKRSSTKGRESCLSAYAHLLRYHYAEEIVDPQLHELIPALLKCIRAGSTDDETLSGIRALTMTIFSTESDSIYGRVYPSLKSVCQDSSSASVKVEAIIAMAVSATHGGGSMTAAEELLDFLLEIVETDGSSIGADDNAPVVTAALAAWGFVASNVENLQDQSDQALEAFTDQLDSTDVDVQVAAGKNIALIFEAARGHDAEEGEEGEEGEEAPAGILQYDQHRLVQRMTALVKESSRTVSKKDRRHLHASFRSVLTSIEHGKGPGYSKAHSQTNNPHTGGTKMAFDGDSLEYGYRERFRVHNMCVMIDTWMLSARLHMLRTVFGGGLFTHYMENPIVKEVLSSAQVELVPGPSYRKGRK